MHGTMNVTFTEVTQEKFCHIPTLLVAVKLFPICVTHPRKFASSDSPPS
jgi:hypothetical protein